MKPPLILGVAALAGGDLNPDAINSALIVEQRFSLERISNQKNFICSVSGCKVQALGSAGHLIGTAFSTHGAMPPMSPEETKDMPIEALANSAWGPFIAFEPRAGAIEVYRDPSAPLPLFIRRVGDSVWFATDIDIFKAAHPASLEIDAEAIARHLIYSGRLSETTCLVGVEELVGGQVIRVKDGSISRWMAWKLDRSILTPIDKMEPAPHLLRRTIESVVFRTAGLFNHVLIELSGGLDSSVLAAAIRATPVHASAITFISDDRAGDEYAEAKAVADHLGIHMLAAKRSVGAVDLTRSSASNLPRPSARAFTQASDRIALEAAADLGADAFFSGGGGDSVFGYTASAAPASAQLLARGPTTTFVKICLDIAEVTNTTVWSVARAAIKMALNPAAGPQPDGALLASGLSAAAARPTVHPWLREVDLPIGELSHLRAVTGVTAYLSGFGRQHHAPLHFPFMSRPIIEACLSIAPHAWNAEGLNRAVIRGAYRDALPAEIIYRRSKGRMDQFGRQVFLENRSLIREMLHDGYLAKHGILDLPEIDRRIIADAPEKGSDFFRILELIDVEAWCSSFSTA